MDLGTRHRVTVEGNGPATMVFAHGFGCDQNMWRLMVPAYAKRFRTVRYDLMGSGKSDLAGYDRERYGTLQGHADDLLAIVREYGRGPVIFVGHSVSSMVGVLAANEEPDRFERLIMVGPSPRYINDEGYVGGFERRDIEGLFEMMDRNFIGWANFMAPAIMKNAERPELGEELTESFCSTDPVIARRFAEATFLADNRDDLPRVTVPSLILQCSDDMVAPVDVGHYLHARLPGSTLRVMKATGHCPHMSDPAETIALMREYLEPARTA